MKSYNTSAKLEVDINAIIYNLNQIKSYIGENVKIVPVIKANAYGGGSVEIAKVLDEHGVDFLAVADLKEGFQLRRAGIDKNIILLYQPNITEIEGIVELDLTICVCNMDFIKKLSECARENNKNIKIHIEVDTGAGRLGIKPKEAISFAKNIKKLNNIELEGIFMHYASSDSEETMKVQYSINQTNIFNNIINELERNNIFIKYKHASCGGALLNYKEAHFNMVRPGYILYGYYPDDYFKSKIKLRPSFKFSAKIIYIKEVEKGTSISYNNTFIANKKSKIATISVGYSDGLKRSLSNKGSVSIKNKKAPIVGRVCMDITMVDITDIEDVRVGDEVFIFDNKIITVDEIADQCDTIGYEIISTISESIQRVYIT